MADVIKYNVGGIKYQVARSLIRMYPKSLLAKIAFSPWNKDEDNDKEIYIERDGDRFRYVLDYLRDGLVFLPATVAKEAVMLDLNYYGLDYSEDVVIGTETSSSSNIYEPKEQLETNLLHFIHQSSLALNSAANIREFWKLYGGWYTRQEIREMIVKLVSDGRITKAFDDDHYVSSKQKQRG